MPQLHVVFRKLPAIPNLSSAYTGVMKRRLKFFLAVGVLCAAVLQAQQLAKWEIGPFVRPEKGNPVVAPRADSTFIDPILKRPVHWEVLHTFNPAAIVRARTGYFAPL